MAGLPVTLKLELDDASNSGTWPTDITSRLELSEGVSVKRGRTDIYSDVQPSELTCRLKNNDGALSRGGLVGTFRDQRIRLSVIKGGTTYRRFTGYARGWPNAWEGGPAKKSFVDMSALDLLPRLGRQQKMSNQLRMEFLRRTPAMYYPLDEPSTAMGCSNLAPGSPAPYLTYLYPSIAPTFGVAAPSVGLEASSQVAINIANQQRIENYAPSNLLAGATRLVLCCAIQGTDPGLFGIAQIGDQTIENCYTISVDPSGGILVRRYSGGVVTGTAVNTTPVTDGNLHLVALEYDGTNLTAWVDGTSTSTALSGSLGTATYVAVGNVYNTGAIGYHVAQFGLFNNVAASTLLPALQPAFSSGFAGESSTQRMARLAAYANVPYVDLGEQNGNPTVPAQPIADQEPLAAMQAVNRAEGGLLFVRTDGQLTMQGRYHRANRLSPTVTLEEYDLDPATMINDDSDQMENYLTGSRVTPPGATTTDTPTMISQDAASVLLHGVYPSPIGFDSLLLSTDAAVQDILDWRRTNYVDPPPRLDSLKIDALTASSTVQTALLAMDLSDRLRLPSLPPQAATLGDLIAEGWTERYQLADESSEWSFDLSASQFAAEQMWILGDSTYGVLGSARLGY